MIVVHCTYTLRNASYPEFILKILNLLHFTKTKCFQCSIQKYNFGVKRKTILNHFQLKYLVRKLNQSITLKQTEVDRGFVAYLITLQKLTFNDYGNSQLECR
jgi:hypothetical protein